MSKTRNEIITTSDSYPYATGMGFRNRCHMIFDEFHQDDGSIIVNEGQVVFVKTDLVQLFFKNVMPSIQHKIKIITHNSALGIDENYRHFLDHPQVIAWYAQNANFEHEKLTSIPLGLANLRWAHGDIDQINKVVKKKNKRTHLVYMNFDINTNIGKREEVFKLFQDKDFVLSAERKPFKDYLLDLRMSKYALSPAGAGIDCHRIWESLAVGTIPIVERCHNISFYEDLPILIIDNWGNVTREFLEDKYEEIMSKNSDSSLLLDHWIDKIGLMDKKYRTIHNQQGSNFNLFMVG